VIEGDLSQYPGAFQARKLPIPVTVSFAESDGVIATREGPVRAQAGDAVLTGVAGERWPIERSKFLQSYQPVSAVPGSTGVLYIKRPITVWALVVNEPTTILLSDDRGALQADRGDVIVQYGANDFAVVGAEIFLRTYEKPRHHEQAKW